MTFDALRRQHPDLGFAAYALDPDGPVTLEMHAFGGVETIVGVSLAACIDKAFPPKPKPKNELTPFEPARLATIEHPDHPGIPEFLRRSVMAAPAPLDETGSIPATKPTSPDSVFD